MVAMLCVDCGFSTQDNRESCDNHRSVAPALVNVPASPMSVGVFELHQKIVDSYEELDGVVSPDRIRQLTVKRVRQHMVAATDEIAASYIDVLDPEERQQRVVNFMRWLTRAENESAIRDEQERRRIFNDPAGLDWVVRGILEQRLLLGYEWELGSRMGVTSREGVQYAAVVEDEFVAYVSKAFVTERVFVARRYLKQFAEIIQYRTGRAPRNSTPLSDEETLRGTVLDPMQWNTDHVSTEQEELELIGMYAEAMHQERMVYEAEMSRRRRETAKSVGLLAGGAALWAVGASLQHSANKQARSDEALSRDYMQTMIDREQRIAAKERNRRWGL